jgi:hypothetical protein
MVRARWLQLDHGEEYSSDFLRAIPQTLQITGDGLSVRLRGSGQWAIRTAAGARRLTGGLYWAASVDVP